MIQNFDDSEGCVEIAEKLGIEASSKNIYKLMEHYGKYLLPFECHFDRGGIDPVSVLAEWEETKQFLTEFKADAAEIVAKWVGESNPGVNNTAFSTKYRKYFQSSPTPSLGSLDSVDSLELLDSSSQSDSEGLHPIEPAFSPGEPSSPPPTKDLPEASYKEYLCLIILTISYLIIYHAYLLYA